jgi:hypothetical protein
MRVLRMSLVVLVIGLFAAAGCSECPIHKALFGSGEEEAAEEAPAPEKQAAPEAPTAPSTEKPAANSAD